MRRVVATVLGLSWWALVFPAAAGEFALSTSPAVDAVIVLDPHDPPVTPTARQATIHLTRRGDASADTAAVFNVPISFPLPPGCDPRLAPALFVATGGARVRMEQWVPRELVISLFRDLGITVDSATTVPTLAVLTYTQCIPDPNSASAPRPGFLFMQARIGFLVPKH